MRASGSLLELQSPLIVRFRLAGGKQLADAAEGQIHLFWPFRWKSNAVVSRASAAVCLRNTSDFLGISCPSCWSNHRLSPADGSQAVTALLMTVPVSFPVVRASARSRNTEDHGTVPITLTSLGFSASSGRLGGQSHPDPEEVSTVRRLPRHRSQVPHRASKPQGAHL